MAGVCVAGGLALDGDGNVILSGTTTAAWPHESTCPIGTRNGLHVDAGTGKAWVKPAQVIGHDEHVGPPRTLVPTNDLDHSIGHYEVNHTVGPCGQEFVFYGVMGGYAAFRLVSGNFWTVARYVTLFVNGVPTFFTGLEAVVTCENNSGGVLSQGTPVEATEGFYVAAPGTVLKLVADYTLQLPDFTTGVLNNFYIRPPRLSLVALPTD